MSFDLQRLYQLLPAIDRIRDGEQGEPLRALLSAIGEQIAVLEEDLAQSYDDHFIETCAEWVAPYIGDLIGYRGLHGVLPKISSPRAEVANTIGYRRRKGTAVMLEQLARDVTGWHAHVVEFFQRLATTQYMNHLRPDNRLPDIGGLTRGLTSGSLSRTTRPHWEPFERLGTAFDSLAHTLDVRRIPPRRGRYNIPDIGIFLWRLNSYSLTEAQPARLDDRRYFFSPLGNNTPLFTLPETLEDFSALATRMNVPDPISRRTLAEYFEEYYGSGKSILLEQNGTLVAPNEIIVCDLSDVGGGQWAHQPVDKIALDPVLGRIAFPSAQIPPDDPRVTFHYGFSDELGGGEYDRDASVPVDSLFRAADVWQIGVSNRLAPKPDEIVATFAEAVVAWNAQPAGRTGVITIVDSGSYDAMAIALPAGSKLLIIAADWPEVEDSLGPNKRIAGQFTASGCPHLRGDLAVKGPGAGEIHFNGLLLEGALRVSANELDLLSLRHCTLVPGRGLTTDNLPVAQREPSLIVEGSLKQLQLDHSITGGLRVPRTVKTNIADSIVDGTSRCGVGYSDLDGFSAGGVLHVENSTLIGKVHSALLELASNTIFFAHLAAHDAWTAPVLSEQRQSGCVRFSYVPPGSITPRRYRCQPATEADAARVVPQFGSLRYGEPQYAQLSRRCPAEVFQGADDESEMGAFHELFEPQRISNLEIRLAEYLRFGLEAGIFFEPKIESHAGRASDYGGFVDLCAENQPLPGIGAGLI